MKGERIKALECELSIVKKKSASVIEENGVSCPQA